LPKLCRHGTTGAKALSSDGVREGWLIPAKRPFQPLPPRKPIAGYALEQLLADLDRVREDRW